MNGFLRMSARDRRLACLQAEEVKHLQAASVEKDFWVCWTLREPDTSGRSSNWSWARGPMTGPQRLG